MPPVMTADDLLRVDIPDKHVELVRGMLVVREPPGLRHGRITVDLATRLSVHVRTNGLGRVYADTGFKLTSDPDTVRGPDIAFINRERVPEPEPPGFPALAPNLVVEVLSPGDRPGEVLAKVADWLSAGNPGGSGSGTRSRLMKAMSGPRTVSGSLVSLNPVSA